MKFLKLKLLATGVFTVTALSACTANDFNQFANVVVDTVTQTVFKTNSGGSNSSKNNSAQCSNKVHLTNVQPNRPVWKYSHNDGQEAYSYDVANISDVDNNSNIRAIVSRHKGDTYDILGTTGDMMDSTVVFYCREATFETVGAKVYKNNKLLIDTNNVNPDIRASVGMGYSGNASCGNEVIPFSFAARIYGEVCK